MAVITGCAVLIEAAAFAGCDVGSAPGIRSLECGGGLRKGLPHRGVPGSARERCCLAFVPKALDRTRAGLHVFSLYGFAADPDGQRANVRWEALAEEQGFLVVYPQGSSFPLRWNVGPEARLDGVDDVHFIVDILDDLSARLTIDPARVYVSGFSNGGHMTHLLACAQADRIAAVGIVEGLGADGPQGCHPARPIPVMGFFSATDPMAQPLGIPDWLTDVIFNVSIEAATPGPASPEAWAADWVNRNGCRQPALTEPLSGAITQQRYAGCAQDSEVVLISIPGMGMPGRAGPRCPSWENPRLRSMRLACSGNSSRSILCRQESERAGVWGRTLRVCARGSGNGFRPASTRLSAWVIQTGYRSRRRIAICPLAHASLRGKSLDQQAPTGLQSICLTS